MKTLYSILGLSSDATVQQIEHSYVSFLSRLENGIDGLSANEVHNQTVAIREAYTTLSNPILRQRYDQQLSAAELNRTLLINPDVSHEMSGWGLFGVKTILLVGTIMLAGIYLYNEKAKEREQLRIEHEHEVQMKAVQIEEDRQKQNAKAQDIALEKYTSDMNAQQLRMAQQQFERESAQRERLSLQRQQLENQQKQQQQREDANRQRQEQLQRQQQAQQQAQREKRLLQQLEHEHYGKVITH